MLRKKRQQLLQAAPERKPTQPITDASFDGGEYCAKVIFFLKKCWQSVFFLSTSFKVLQSVKTTSNTVTAGDRWTMHLPISPRPHPCFHTPAWPTRHLSLLPLVRRILCKPNGSVASCLRGGLASKVIDVSTLLLGTGGSPGPQPPILCGKLEARVVNLL